MGIGDWGLGIGDWAQSPIPNPQSPIPNPQSPTKGEFICQGQVTFSSESINSLSEENFIRILSEFYNLESNDACIVYYSGHGFSDGTLLFENPHGKYLLGYEDIIGPWRNRTNKDKCKHLLIILDCCYSGKWVKMLLDNGDFSEVSIQASSTDKQESQDLGLGIGGLFTNIFIKENGTKILEEDSLTDKLYEYWCQVYPLACGFSDISKLNYGLKIMANSWLEFILPPSKIYNLYSNPTENLEYNLISYDLKYMTIFQHGIFKFEEYKFTGQCEFATEKYKHIFSFKTTSNNFLSKKKRNSFFLYLRYQY